MDDNRFDALTKSLSRLASRRDMVRVTVGSGIATALATLGLGDAGAKKKGKGKNKKKKCKKPKVKCKRKCCAAGQVCAGGKCTTPPPAEECQFTKTATQWTLQSDCTISKTIEIPNGVTLDGNNKTITMSGNVSGYFKEVPDDWAVAAAVLANGGNANVHDLTIRGSGLTGSCSPTGPEGLAFINSNGTIQGVTVENIHVDECGVGISVTGTGGQAVEISGVEVRDVGQTGILGLSRENTAGVAVDIVGTAVANPGVNGIAFEGPVNGSVVNSEIRGEGFAGIGIVSPLALLTDQTISISTTEVSGRIGAGINGFAVGSGDGAQLNVTVSGFAFSAEGEFEFGIGLDAPHGSLTVSDSTIEGGTGLFGIFGCADRSFEVSNTSVIGGQIGIATLVCRGPASGSANFNGNTIVGPPANANVALGISYDLGAGGTADGNTISNFFDTDPGQTSCGIGVFENAGEVTIGTNTFPDPPGNEEDICLDIPVEPIELAGRKGKDALGIEALRQMRNRADRFKASDHAGRDRRRSKQKNKGGRAHQKRGGKH